MRNEEGTAGRTVRYDRSINRSAQPGSEEGFARRTVRSIDRRNRFVTFLRRYKISTVYC